MESLRDVLCQDVLWMNFNVSHMVFGCFGCVWMCVDVFGFFWLKYHNIFLDSHCDPPGTACKGDPSSVRVCGSLSANFQHMF